MTVLQYVGVPTLGEYGLVLRALLVGGDQFDHTNRDRGRILKGEYQAA
jgi:hypothetical protein